MSVYKNKRSGRWITQVYDPAIKRMLANREH
mgnify:CR=1 FL=1